MLKRCAILALKGDKYGMHPKSKDVEAFKNLMRSYTNLFGAADPARLLAGRDGGDGNFIWVYAALVNPQAQVVDWVKTYGPGQPLVETLNELYTAQATSRAQAMAAYIDQLRASNTPQTATKPLRTAFTTFAVLRTLLNNALEKQRDANDGNGILIDGCDEDELDWALKQVNATEEEDEDSEVQDTEEDELEDDDE